MLLLLLKKQNFITTHYKTAYKKPEKNIIFFSGFLGFNEIPNSYLVK